MALISAKKIRLLQIVTYYYKKTIMFYTIFFQFPQFYIRCSCPLFSWYLQRIKSCNSTCMCACAVLKLFTIQTFWIFFSQFLIYSTQKLLNNFFSRMAWCDALVCLCLQSKGRNLFCKNDESSSPTRHDFSFLLFVFLLLSFSSFATPR